MDPNLAFHMLKQNEAHPAHNMQKHFIFANSVITRPPVSILNSKKKMFVTLVLIILLLINQAYSSKM